MMRVTRLLAPQCFLALVAVSAAPGQDIVNLAGESAGAEARLRWTLPSSELPDAEFVIERTDDRGNVQRFTVPSPLPREEAVRRGLIGEDEYAELVRTFARDETLGAEAREERAFNRAMLTLSSVTRPGWAAVLGTIFRDTFVTEGQEYAYRVTTVVEGQAVVIGETRITAGSASPLPAITGLAGETDPGGVSLRWDPAEDGFIASYRVYRADPDGTERDLAEGGLFISRQTDPETGELRLPEVFLRDSTVVANATYSYSVAGINLFGRETPRSEGLSVFFPDPTPLEVPGVSAADVRDREVEVFWAAPADGRIAGVGVLRSEDPVQQGTLLTPDLLPAEATSYVDTSVVGGVSYYYSLVSVDQGGRRFGPSPPWAARAISLSPPSAPQNLSLTPTEQSLELSWQAPPEPDIRGYQVFIIRDTAEDRRILLTDELIADTAYSLPVPPGTLDELTVAVRAVNTSFVEGPLSAPVAGRILDTVPPARPILRRIRGGERLVELSWVFTSDPDVVEYRVRRSIQGDGTAGEDGSPTTIVREGLMPVDTVHVDSAATPGLLHVYAVEAVDASGNVSPPSAPLAATPYRLTRPDPPRQLAARLAEEGGAQLSWEAPDTGGIMFYVLERGTADGRFVQVGAPVLAEATTVTDPAGRPGHSYRVRAIDTAGNVSEPSEAVPLGE